MSVTCVADEKKGERRYRTELPWFSLSYLDVLHVLKEVRLWVVVVGELHQVSELLLGGKGLYQAGQYSGVVMLNTLVERRKEWMTYSY